MYVTLYLAGSEKTGHVLKRGATVRNEDRYSGEISFGHSIFENYGFILSYMGYLILNVLV